MKLGIIIGHTRKAKGAYSKTLGQSEYEYNSELAELMVKHSGTFGIDVLIETRDVGGIAGAYARMLKRKPAAIIELHFNAATALATGTETLYADSKDMAGVREVILAKMVNDAMVKALGLKDRGIKKLMPGGRGYGNVAQTKNIPSILIEPFFGSNAKDSRSARDNKTRLAVGILSAVSAWSKA